MNKTTFALFFGNRGFFPASLIASAREEMQRELNALGHEVLMLDADATRYGAVETPLKVKSTPTSCVPIARQAVVA